MVQISEVKGNKRDNRTAAHTHIKGLGLKLDGTAESQAAGFVGQTTAREVGSPRWIGIGPLHVLRQTLSTEFSLIAPSVHRPAAS